MAMVKCSECGKEISGTAAACPGCGRQPKKPIGTMRVIAIIIFVAFVYKMTTATSERIQNVATSSLPAAPSTPDPTYDLVLKTPAEREADKIARAKRAKERAKQAKKEGVLLGMSEAEVVASSWGKPRKINTTTRATGVRAQWVYDGGYLYFENGVLTSIQN